MSKQRSMEITGLNRKLDRVRKQLVEMREYERRNLRPGLALRYTDLINIIDMPSEEIANETRHPHPVVP